MFNFKLRETILHNSGLILFKTQIAIAAPLTYATMRTCPDHVHMHVYNLNQDNDRLNPAEYRHHSNVRGHFPSSDDLDSTRTLYPVVQAQRDYCAVELEG